MINIYYLVKSYDFTSQLMILTLDTVSMVFEIYQRTHFVGIPICNEHHE